MTPAGSDPSDPPNLKDDQAQQLMVLADGLMERARTLAAQADQLIFALDLAAGGLLESGRGLETSPIVAPVGLLQGTPAPAEAAADSEWSVSDGVRQLITRMALAGSGHDEIAQRLREDFGFEDVDELVRKVVHSARLAGAARYGAGQRPSPVMSNRSVRVSFANTAQRCAALYGGWQAVRTSWSYPIGLMIPTSLGSTTWCLVTV